MITGIAFIPRGSTRGDVSHYITLRERDGDGVREQYKDVEHRLPLARARSRGASRADGAAARVGEPPDPAAAGAAADPGPPAAQRLRTRLIAFYKSQEQVAHKSSASPSTSRS